MNEDQFKKQVTDLAELCGWEWVHFRPCIDKGEWRTAVDGTMGVGWPDLILVSDRRRQMLIVELKSETGQLKPRQKALINWLQDTFNFPGGNVQCHVWRPKDFDTIQRVLA